MSTTFCGRPPPRFSSPTDRGASSLHVTYCNMCRKGRRGPARRFHRNRPTPNHQSPATNHQPPRFCHCRSGSHCDRISVLSPKMKSVQETVQKGHRGSWLVVGGWWLVISGSLSCADQTIQIIQPIKRIGVAGPI